MTNHTFHLSNRFAHPDKNRPADDRVPDIEFLHLRDSRDRHDVAVVQPVAGVEPHASLADPSTSFFQAKKLFGHFLGRRVGVRTGVQFDRVETEFPCEFDLGLFRIEEGGNDDALALEPLYRRCDAVGFAFEIEAAFGRDFLPLFRDERCLVRFARQGQLDNFRHNAHFQIEPALHGLAENLEIAIVYVPTILAQMDRNGVGAAQLAFGGRPGRIGFVGSASLPQGCHVIDIDAQLHH